MIPKPKKCPSCDADMRVSGSLEIQLGVGYAMVDGKWELVTDTDYGDDVYEELKSAHRAAKFESAGCSFEAGTYA